MLLDTGAWTLFFSDHIGQESTLTMPQERSNNLTPFSSMSILIDKYNGIASGAVSQTIYGRRTVLAASIPENNSLNIDLNLNTVDTSGFENKVIVPMVDPSKLDFLSGDIVNLSTNPMKAFILNLQARALDPLTNLPFTVTAGYIIGRTAK